MDRGATCISSASGLVGFIIFSLFLWYLVIYFMSLSAWGNSFHAIQLTENSLQNGANWPISSDITWERNLAKKDNENNGIKYSSDNNFMRKYSLFLEKKKKKRQLDEKASLYIAVILQQYFLFLGLWATN